MSPAEQTRLDIIFMAPEDRAAAQSHFLEGLMREERIDGAFTAIAGLPEAEARELLDSKKFQREFELDEQDAEETPPAVKPSSPEITRPASLRARIKSLRRAKGIIK